MEYRTILTDTGLAAVAAAAQAGEQVQITHLAMGDGGGMEYAPDSAQTSLKNERWRGAIASYTRDGNRFTVNAHMPAETEAFVVRELALFLSDGTCFAVANAPSVPHQPPVDGVGTEFETIMPFAVENADSVTVAVDPTGGIPWSMVGQPNGVAGLDETGKVPESQLPDLNFDPSGSAAAVQRQLETHTGNRNNPHGVTAAQVGAFTKAQTLTAETAALVGLGADAEPDAVFAKIKALIDSANTNANSRIRLKTGTYIGTGTSSSQVNLGVAAKIVIVGSQRTASQNQCFGIASTVFEWKYQDNDPVITLSGSYITVYKSKYDGTGYFNYNAQGETYGYVALY